MARAGWRIGVMVAAGVALLELAHGETTTSTLPPETPRRVTCGPTAKELKAMETMDLAERVAVLRTIRARDRERGCP